MALPFEDIAYGHPEMQSSRYNHEVSARTMNTINIGFQQAAICSAPLQKPPYTCKFAVSILYLQQSPSAQIYGYHIKIYITKGTIQLFFKYSSINSEAWQYFRRGAPSYQGGLDVWCGPKGVRGSLWEEIWSFIFQKCILKLFLEAKSSQI